MLDGWCAEKVLAWAGVVGRVWEIQQTRIASLTAMAFHDPDSLQKVERELASENETPVTAEEIFAKAEAALELMRGGVRRVDSV